MTTTKNMTKTAWSLMLLSGCVLSQVLATPSPPSNVLSWSKKVYDDQRRVVAAYFSDGTCISNFYDCCSLQSTRSRDGTVTEYWRDTGGWSAEAKVTLGNLPGLNGAYPVVETLVDAFGRITNQTVCAWNNGARCSDVPALTTTTEYPYGLTPDRITTDPFGNQTSIQVEETQSARTTTTHSPGITNVIMAYRGGKTIHTDHTTNGIMATTYATIYSHEGRAETMTIVTNNVMVTNIVTRRYDITGKPVAVPEEPPAAIPLTTVNYQEISNVWYRTSVSAIITNGLTNTILTVMRQLTGLPPSINQRLAIADSNGTVVITTSLDSATAIRTVTRHVPALGTTETTAYLGSYPVYAVDAAGTTNSYSYMFDDHAAIVLSQSSGRGMLSLNPQFEVATHFVQLKLKLTGELVALCPQKSKSTKKGKPCCEPSSCKADAEALTAAYIASLENAWIQRAVSFGGSTGNAFLWLYQTNSNWTGQEYPEDLYPGLVCGGWTDMASDVLSLPIENSDCWQMEAETSRNWFMALRNMDSHIWEKLFVEKDSGSVSLDPWPSGGWEY